MNTSQSEGLEYKVRIAARPEIVFSYFTDPAKMTRWCGTLCALDPKPGGIYRVEINEHFIQRGHYVEVIPYSRLVFTWGLEGESSPVPPGSTTVEITLIPDGEGTIVQLRHYGLPSSEQDRMLETGWGYYLERLVMVAEGRDPGVDPLQSTIGMSE